MAAPATGWSPGLAFGASLGFLAFLLVAVAGRLQTCIRGEDTVACLGGDEFAVLLRAGPQPRGGRARGQARPGGDAPALHPRERQGPGGASVGVTVSDATEVDDVLREADVAMYTAKARGKGRFELASTSSRA